MPLELYRRELVGETVASSRVVEELDVVEHVRTFTAQPPDLRRLSLDHESFAVRCPLALLGTASYPVLVHRLAASLHASSPHSVTLMQLRFASFAVVSLWEDFHLQDGAHAWRTTRTARSLTGRFVERSPINLDVENC